MTMLSLLLETSESANENAVVLQRYEQNYVAVKKPN